MFHTQLHSPSTEIPKIKHLHVAGKDPRLTEGVFCGERRYKLHGNIGLHVSVSCWRRAGCAEKKTSTRGRSYIQRERTIFLDPINFTRYSSKSLS